MEIHQSISLYKIDEIYIIDQFCKRTKEETLKALYRDIFKDRNLEKRLTLYA